MIKGPLRIGAVARLVGVPAATIRTWERRYGAADPDRTEGHNRVYHDADVERLRRIAWLRDRGERVADLALLPLEALAARQSAYEVRDGEEDVGELLSVVRVVLVGSHPPAVGGVADGLTTVEVVQTADTPSALSVEARADIAVVELAALGTDPPASVRWLRDHRGVSGVLVLYTFSTRQVLAELVAEGARTLRGSAANAEIRQAVVDLARARRAVTPRSTGQRFDRETLRALIHRPVDVACECPNHLAALVLSLCEFEQYSRECESQSPRDAELHAELGRGTAQARVLMEALLAQVQKHEGLD